MKKQGSMQQQYKAKEKNPNEYQQTDAKKAKSYNDDAPPKGRKQHSQKHDIVEISDEQFKKLIKTNFQSFVSFQDNLEIKDQEEDEEEKAEVKEQQWSEGDTFNHLKKVNGKKSD